MENQYKLFSEESLNKLIVEKPKIDYSKRIELSTKEQEKYSIFPVSKKKLYSLFKKNSTELDNPNIPSMLMTSVAEYNKKEKTNLNLSDFMVLRKNLEDKIDAFKPSEKSSKMKKWRKENNLSRFGFAQYQFLEVFLDKVLEDLDH